LFQLELQEASQNGSSGARADSEEMAKLRRQVDEQRKQLEELRRAGDQRAKQMDDRQRAIEESERQAKKRKEALDQLEEKIKAVIYYYFFLFLNNVNSFLFQLIMQK
jgi:hypothetical protein